MPSGPGRSSRVVTSQARATRGTTAPTAEKGVQPFQERHLEGDVQAGRFRGSREAGAALPRPGRCPGAEGAVRGLDVTRPTRQRCGARRPAQESKDGEGRETRARCEQRDQGHENRQHAELRQQPYQESGEAMLRGPAAQGWPEGCCYEQCECHGSGRGEGTHYHEPLR
jgi:hypothetical protein